MNSRSSRQFGKAILWIFVFTATAVGAGRDVFYATHDKTAVVDTAQSIDGVYEVILQKVGEPQFPFGSASGKLLLKKGEMIVSEADFETANDGAQISGWDWSVAWYDDYVEIILSGEEQYDEFVVLYYTGEVERYSLTTRGGIGTENVESNAVETVGYELFSDEQRISDGYKAIYELFFDSPIEDLEIYYGAKESSSRCVLSENENTIEYLVYSGKSENESCGLYVRYQGGENADGTWTDTCGTIVDIYAYVYESGEVVSSGKTQWEDSGSEAYRQTTGEK